MKRKMLITGASGDIGLSLIQTAGAQNYDMVAQYYKKTPNFPKDSGVVSSVQADLTHPDEAKRLVQEAVNKLDGLDVLVLLAGGIANPTHWTKLQPDEWRFDLDINLSASFFVVQAAQEYLRKSASGRVILVSTASTKKGGGPTSLGYGVAKAGLECLTKQFAREMAKDSVLVNCVSPGFIRTRFHTERMNRSEKDLEARKAFVPLGRAGTPDEVAEVISFLISEKNSYVTGEILRIDGGDFI